MNVIRQKNLTNAGALPLEMNETVNAPPLRLKLYGNNDHYIRPVVRWAFYGFLATIPFETMDLGIPLEITMISLGILLISLLFQISLIFRKPPVAFGLFLIYLLICFLSFAVNTPYALVFEATWQLMVLTQLVAMSWIAFNILKSERVAQKALLILALSCALLVVLQQLGILQSLEGVGGRDRITALGFHPNNIARILALGLLSIAGLVYAVKKSVFKSRLWVWIIVAILGIAIVQTGSRGGLLALGAGLLVFVFRQGAVSTRFRNGAFVVVGFVFILTIVFQSEMSLSRFKSVLEDGNLAGREQIYPIAWEMIKEKPVFGWGVKAGEYELGARFAHPEEERKNAHNLILYVLVSVGLVGFVPLMLGIWLTLKTAWKTRGGVRGVLPLSLLITVLVANMSGVWINNKMHWIVTAYVLSSSLILKRSVGIYFGQQSLSPTSE